MCQTPPLRVTKPKKQFLYSSGTNNQGTLNDFHLEPIKIHEEKTLILVEENQSSPPLGLIIE